MIGNYCINFGVGIVGFILIFFVVYSSNLLMISLICGLIGFVVWYVFVFVLCWGLGLLLILFVGSKGFDYDF